MGFLKTKRLLAGTPLIGHISMPLYRNGYALILSSVATSVLGLMYWVLAARYYSTDVVGLNSAILSAMLFLSVVAQLNLGGMLVRFVPLAGPVSPRLIGYTYVASCIASVVISLVFLVGLGIWSPTLRVLTQDAGRIVWFVFGTVTWSIFSLQDSALTALREAVWVPVENALFGVVKIILLILLAGTLTQYGIFASWTIPVAISLIPINFFIFQRFIPKHIRGTGDRAVPIIPRQLYKYVSGNYLGSIFFQASTTLLPVIVIDRLCATMNAYFYLPWTITTSLQLVALNMATSFTVEAARDHKNLSRYGSRVLIHNLRMLVPLVLIIGIGAPYILGIFGANYAAAGTDMLRLLALSVIPYSFVALYVGLARVQNQVHRIVVVQGVRCALLLLGCYWLLPILGITGIGWVWLVTETLVGGFLFLTQLRPLFFKPRVVNGEETEWSVT